MCSELSFERWKKCLISTKENLNSNREISVGRSESKHESLAPLSMCYSLQNTVSHQNTVSKATLWIGHNILGQYLENGSLLPPPVACS